ncbi:MAG: hypothetical protein PUE68_02570 [Kiritimatiellae bacterium]|nr:hypothetical protein [Kiritimatiellia bacterium]
MKLSQLALSLTSDEITQAVRNAAARAAEANAQLPPEIAELSVRIEGGKLVVATKKKLGFMPIPISATIGLRPSADANGIAITLEKLSAGPIGSQAVVGQVLGEIGRALTGKPGCSVNGNDIVLTKEALAAKAPWLSVPGKVNRFDIVGDTLEISIG